MHFAGSVYQCLPLVAGLQRTCISRQLSCGRHGNLHKRQVRAVIDSKVLSMIDHPHNTMACVK
jgi:hypothetical protein